MASVPKISVMITFRQRRFELVDAFVDTHRSDVAEAFELMLQDSAEEPTWTFLIDPLIQRLSSALQNLIEAEHRHLDELGGQALLRQRRDQGIAELRQVLFDLRQAYRGLYGQDQVQEIGFEKRIAKDPLPLLRQGERLHDQFLETAEPSRPPLAPRYTGLEISSEQAASHLEPRLRELRETMGQVHDRLVRVQRTKVAKDRAMREFDENYRSIVKMLISVLRLSGQTELAAKLPISLRRDSKKAS